MSTENPIQIVEAKLNEWDLPKKTKDEQVAELRPLISDAVIRFATAGDNIESLTVHEDLFEAVSEAIGSAELPKDFSDPSGADWEAVNAEFLTLCKSIPVKSAPTGYFAQANPEYLNSLAPVQVFVSFMTRTKREMIALQQFDMKYGISQHLAKAGIAFQPTPAEMRLLSMIVAIFESGSAAQQQQIDQKAILQATAGPDFAKIITK